MPVEYFNVLDRSGRTVAAKTLVDVNGNTVMNPNTGLPLIVPADYDPAAAIAIGRAIAATRDALLNSADPYNSAAASAYTVAEMARLFSQGGSQDLQRSYNGTVGGGGSEFVPSFTAAASYNLGLIGAAAGLSFDTLQVGGGAYNAFQWIKSFLTGNPQPNTSGDWGNNPENTGPIAAGSQAFGNGDFGPPPNADPNAPGNPSAPFHKGGSPLLKKDPLILDLDGNGVALTRVQDSNAHFDYGGTGFAPKTGWVGAGDGILVRDLNSDGAVTANELFGATSGNGFNDLAGLDGNADGKVDAGDAAFGDLKVWQDADGDGIADAGELSSLTTTGIAAINLARQVSGQNINGNVVVETATFTRTDNSTSTIAEVNFATDALYSRYTPPEGFQYSQSAFLLPALVGYGNVPDLIYSMSLNPALEAAARNLVMNSSMLSGSAFAAAFEGLVQKWAGVDGIDPASRGSLIDARHIALVEAFYGATFAQLNGEGATLNAVTANNVEATYVNIISELMVRFASQVALSQVLNDLNPTDAPNSPFLAFGQIAFDKATDGLAANLETLVETIAFFAPSDIANSINYFDLTARILKGYGVGEFESVDDFVLAFRDAAAAAANLDAGMQALVVAELEAVNILDASSVAGTVNGTGLTDAIVINEGGHTVSGKDAADNYIYIDGQSGSAIIDDASTSSGDKLVLIAADPADVTLSRNGASDDVTLSFAGGGSVTIKNQFVDWGYGVIETVQFADGTTWTPSQIRQALLDRQSAAASGGVYGFTNSDDTLIAGTGGKLLSGLSGNDTYIYAPGGGDVTIDDASANNTAADKLVLNGVNPADVTLSRAGASDDVTLTFAGGGSVTIKNQFVDWGYGVIETVQFADDTTWTPSQIRQALLDRQSAAASGGVYGFTNSDDTLVAGTGGKLLSGLSGNDTYIYAPGGGDVTIDDASANNTVADKLVLNGINPADVTLSRAGASDDVTLTFAGGGSVTIKNQFVDWGYGVIETVQFADGTTWAPGQIKQALLDRQSAAASGGVYGFTNSDDTLVAGTGGKLLSGLSGNDTYVYAAGGGDVTIDDASASNTAADKLILTGIDRNDVTFARIGSTDDVRIDIAGGGSVTIKNQFVDWGYGVIESFEFANGTILSAADVQAIIDGNAPGTPTHVGTAGADTINGTSGDDIIDGLGGNDTINGGSGGDTYLHRAGSGNDTIGDSGSSSDVDTLKLIGVNPSDVALSHSGSWDLLVQRVDTGETVKVEYQFLSPDYGIDKILFDDGTFWDHAFIAANTIFRGTVGVESIYGTSGADTFDGLGGDDALNGNGGSDTYLHRAGSGNDIVDDSGSSSDVDTLRLMGVNASNVTLARSGDYDFIVHRADTGEDIKVLYQFLGSDYGLEKIQFDDGAYWDRAYIAANVVYLGTSGADTINGSGASDILDGLGGNDTLQGKGASDTYLHRAGSGNDIIYDSGVSSDVDTLRLIGVNSSDVTLDRSGSYDFIVNRADTGEAITVQYQFLTPDYGLEKIQFDDGTIWDRAYIGANSIIRGTAGADTLNGTSNADTLDGGAGNDTLNGGSNGDTYIYGAGSGNDTIAENTDSSAIDKIKLIGLNPADVTFSRTGDDLFITVGSTGEQLKVQNHFASTSSGIEQLIFADNTVWDRTAILLKVPPIMGTSGNDTIFGTSSDNVFNAGLGNDTIRSGGGSDFHIYAAGDGNDLIDEESGSTTEIDTLWLTDINPDGITLTRSGVHMLVNITGTGQQITIDEQYYSASSNWGIEQIRFADGTTLDRDQLAQNTWWNGTSGNDNLSGWSLYDNIDGGAGNDTINGNAGIDRLVGGTGDDTITGGSGNDTIIFRAGFGNDTITDFTAGAGSDDVIDFYDGVFADFAAVQSASQQIGNDVKITVDASNSITLQNVTLASLHQDDFRHF